MNKCKIPPWLEKEVREREKNCIYCGIPMIEKAPRNRSRKSVATWEHIVNDASIVNRYNIARCCFSCNASKGQKKLPEWFESPYCKKHGINQETVADVVKQVFNNLTLQEKVG